MSTIRYNCSGTQFEIVLPDHGRAHEWVNGQPGNDVISVHPRMLAMLRTTTIEDSVVLNVSPFYYMYDNQFKVFKSDTINMTDYLPTTPAYAKLVLVGLDMATNTLSVVEGAEQFDSAVTPPPLPDNLPLSFIPSALVKLRYNVTVLNEVDVTDARIYIVGNIAGGIDSSGEPAGYVLTADGSGGVVWESVASGGAWPAPNKCKNGETEYDTLEAAIAASTPSDTIKVGEGEFELTDTVAISHGLTIVGTGPGRFDYGTYIYAATGNPALSTGSTLILSNLSIEGIDSSGYFLAEGCYLYDLELSRNGTIGRIDNCSLDTSNTSYALNCTGSGTIDLFDCIIYDAIEGTGSVTINLINCILDTAPSGPVTYRGFYYNDTSQEFVYLSPIDYDNSISGLTATDIKSAIDEIISTRGSLATQDQITASDIDAESSTSGQVLISDGAGNAAWGDQSEIFSTVGEHFDNYGGIVFSNASNMSWRKIIDPYNSTPAWADLDISGLIGWTGCNQINPTYSLAQHPGMNGYTCKLDTGGLGVGGAIGDAVYGELELPFSAINLEDDGRWQLDQSYIYFLFKTENLATWFGDVTVGQFSIGVYDGTAWSWASDSAAALNLGTLYSTNEDRWLRLATSKASFIYPAAPDWSTIESVKLRFVLQSPIQASPDLNIYIDGVHIVAAEDAWYSTLDRFSERIIGATVSPYKVWPYYFWSVEPVEDSEGNDSYPYSWVVSSNVGRKVYK